MIFLPWNDVEASERLMRLSVIERADKLTALWIRNVDGNDAMGVGGREDAVASRGSSWSHSTVVIDRDLRSVPLVAADPV